MDQLLKQKINFHHDKYLKALDKFDNKRYAWATILEGLIASDVDLTGVIDDEEIDEILDWKLVYDTRNQDKEL